MQFKVGDRVVITFPHGAHPQFVSTIQEINEDNPFSPAFKYVVPFQHRDGWVSNLYCRESDLSLIPGPFWATPIMPTDKSVRLPEDINAI